MRYILAFVFLSSFQFSFAHEGPEWFDINHRDLLEGASYTIQTPPPEIFMYMYPVEDCRLALTRTRNSNYQWAYSTIPNWTAFLSDHTIAQCGNSSECIEPGKKGYALYFAVRAYKNNVYGRWSNEVVCKTY